MRLATPLTGGLVLSLTVLSSASFAQVAASRGWSITYADGRTVTNPLRPKAGMWTPNFPRIVGANLSRDGRPLYVMDVSYVAEGDDVVATVALVYGRFQDRVSVAEVRVTPTHPAVITQLRAYGVEPVTLAIVPLEPSLALPFIAEEPSGELEIRVDTVRADTPLFRIVIRNDSGKDLRAIDYAVYEGPVRVATGRRKQERNEPLAPAGGEYSFDYWTSRSTNLAPRTPDRLVVTSVMWDDGSVDGERTGAAQEHAMAVTRARQLERLLNAIGSDGPPRIEALRSAFAGLDRSDFALEHERTAALAELDQLERDGDVTGLLTWTTSRRAELFAWLARVNHALQ